MCCQERFCGEVSLMHKAYTKIVKEKFSSALSVALSDFRLSRLQRNAHRGRLYSQNAGNGVTLFVALILHDNADEFSIDIGFSRDGLCPEESFFLAPNETSPCQVFCSVCPSFGGIKTRGGLSKSIYRLTSRKQGWSKPEQSPCRPRSSTQRLIRLLVTPFEVCGSMQFPTSMHFKVKALCCRRHSC